MDTEIRKALRRFLGDFIRVGALKDEDNLFSAGLVNSLFAMQLVLYVESAFDLTVANEDLNIANFCSVDAMTRFILTKRNASALT